jgi:DNA polymerase-3 subunit chi
VVVGEGKQPASPRDLLVNEATDVPTFVDRFARVAEVVNQDDGVRRRSRARYAAYRDQGYTLHHYRVS